MPFVSFPNEATSPNSVTLLLEQLVGSDVAQNQSNYVRILDSIGSIEERIRKASLVLECFDPVWPNLHELTKVLMQRICITLLPETGTEEAV